MLEGSDFGNFQPEPGGQFATIAEHGVQALAEVGVVDRFAGEIDGHGGQAEGQAFQGQVDGGQVKLAGHRQAGGDRHEAAGGQPFAILGGLQAQRAFQVEQGAAAIGDGEFDQAQPLRLDSAFEHLPPVGVVVRALGVVAVGATPAQIAFTLGRGNRGIDAGEQAGQAFAVAIDAAADMTDSFAVDQARRDQIAQQGQQLVGDRRRVVVAGQQQGEVGTIESGGGGTGLGAGVAGKMAANPAQQFVGTVAAEAAIDPGQIGQTQHDQAAAGWRVIVVERRCELVHEIGTVGQPGQTVEGSFATDLFETGGFFLEHGLDPRDHGIHRAGQAFQFRGGRLVDTDEATLADRLSLPDHGIQRTLDAQQDLHADQPHQHAASAKPDEQPESAVPQLAVGKLVVADQFDRAELGPAVGDLGRAGVRFDREQADEPGRHAAGGGWAGLFDHRLAFRIDDPDLGILATVEHSGNLQFDGDRVLVQLRHGEGQRSGVVVVLDRQLLLKIIAGGHHADDEAAGKGDDGAGDDGEPELSEQGHGHLPHWKPSARARASRSCQRERLLLLVWLPVPCQRPALLKLKTGERSCRCDAGRICLFRLSRTSGSALGRG